MGWMISKGCIKRILSTIGDKNLKVGILKLTKTVQRHLDGDFWD
jgi:hypothetical protein